MSLFDKEKRVESLLKTRLFLQKNSSALFLSAIESALFSAVLLMLWSSILQASGHHFLEPFWGRKRIGAIFMVLLVALLLAWRGADRIWSRLEALHRRFFQEREEIQNERERKKGELTALYKAKGCEEPFLSELVALLSVDSDLFLKIMLEERLGLPLAQEYHPLERAGAAFFGALLGGSLAVGASFLFSGIYLGFLVGFFCAFLSVLRAYLVGNEKTKAFVWGVSVPLLFFVITQLFLDFIQE